MAYDRPPENPVVYTHKDFGAAFFDRTLPNSNERMFMICRSINFDLGNYNKLYSNPDSGARRRYFRNFFRFIDHPIAYMFWKTKPYFDAGRVRLLPFYWGVSLFLTWWWSGRNFKKDAEKRAREDFFDGMAEQDIEKESFSYSRLLGMHFHHSEANGGRGMLSNLSYPPMPIFCRLNYHVRDQNLRKYFAHRERREADLFTGKPLSN